MVDETARVKVKVTVDKKELDDLSKRIGKGLDIKGQFKEKFQNLLGGALGKSGVSGAVGGAVGGAMFGAVMIIADVVGKIFSLFVESSAVLKNVLGQIMKTVGLFLRPFADFIGTLLTPLVYILLPLARALNLILRPFITSFRKRLSEERQAGAFDLGGAFDPLGAVSRSLIGAIGDWMDIMGAPMAGAIIQGIAEGLLELSVILTDVLQGATEALINSFFDLGIVITNTIFGTMDNLIQGFQALGNSFFDVIEALSPLKGVTIGARKAFNDTVNGIRKNVTTLRTSVLDGIEDMREDVLIKVEDVFGAIKRSILNALENIRSAVSVESSASRAVKKKTREVLTSEGGILSFQKGGLLTEDALIMGHKGERVLSASEAQGSVGRGGGLSVNVPLTVIVQNSRGRSDEDFRDLAEKVSIIIREEIGRYVSYI